MESIEIRNFGPIDYVKLDLKDINVFIGTTASGKSTVAKLISIFKSREFLSEGSESNFVEMLSDYNINFGISINTFIQYKSDDFYWRLQEKKLQTDFPFGGIIEVMTSTLNSFNGYEHEGRIVKHYEQFRLYQAATAISIIENEMVDDTLAEDERKLVKALVEIRDKLIHSSDADMKLMEKDISATFISLANKIGLSNSLYIPAERSLLSMVGQSIFGLMDNNVTIAKSIKYFGSEFEAARKQFPKFPINPLEAEFKYADDTNSVRLIRRGIDIKLEEASSGFQSLIPLFVVIYARTERKGLVKNYILIEEPELNLYPTVQKELIEFVVERVNKHRDKLIITTHSPYILTSLDNLIQAHNTAQVDAETEEKVKKLVPPECWVDFDRVACYYFKDGTCESTLDEEYRSIGTSNIDDVSDDIGNVYDQLLKLKYADVS